MQRGNWVPIDKGLVSSLPSPGSREYSEVEAAFCVTVDYDNGKLVSQNGYATLWKWSRGRVKRFAEKRGWSISEEVPRGLNKLQIDREKEGCVIHDPTWIKRTTDDTTSGQPADNQRTTDDTTSGQPKYNNNDCLSCHADNQRTTDDTTSGQPADNQRTTDDTLLYILDPNPNPKKSSNSYSEKFLAFWEEYPKKQGKAAAWKTWKAKKLDSAYEKIMRSLLDHKQWEGWTKENGKYIPMGSSWIYQERYEDEIELNGISTQSKVFSNSEPIKIDPHADMLPGME